MLVCKTTIKQIEDEEREEQKDLAIDRRPRAKNSTEGFTVQKQEFNLLKLWEDGILFLRKYSSAPPNREVKRRLTDSIIDPQLPKEQAGFRHGRPTVDQTVLLMQNIEHSFEANMKAGAEFVDLTRTYGTVWHRSLTCKLLRLLPDKHMVRMILELIQNRSFISIYTIFPPQPPENMLMPMIWLCCIQTGRAWRKP